MTDLATDRPTRIGAVLALGAGLMGALGVGMYSLSALGVGVMGVLVLAIGLLLPRPGMMSLGATVVFAGAIVGAMSDVPIGGVLVATIGAVLAWDLAHNAASHGRQVGAAARTTDPEALHAAGTFGAGILSAGVAYAGYRAAAGGQPSMAVGILLFGCIVAVFAFR